MLFSFLLLFCKKIDCKKLYFNNEVKNSLKFNSKKLFLTVTTKCNYNDNKNNDNKFDKVKSYKNNNS